jgi:hypothetical protein
MQRTTIFGIAIGIAMSLCTAGSVWATPSPNGPGQPGAPGTTCGSMNASVTPGNAGSASGSPFNPSGNAGLHYAGNPGTASLANANSAHAVSQYDIACFQVTSH